MAVVRIYQPGHYQLKDTLALDPGPSHHVGTVLRMRIGEKLCLFCGDNREFSATILQISKKAVQVSIDHIQEVNRESPLSIHLAQGVSKGDKMELIVQKAVELGVTSLTPILSSRCAIKFNQEQQEKKLRQWQAIAVGACEQSGRNWLPLLHPMLPLDTYLKQVQISSKWILQPGESQSLQDKPAALSELAILIGPEGGFSEAEVTAAKTAGFQPFALGPRILRTETAAITALSVLQAFYGDL